MSQLATPSSKKTGALIQDWRPEDSVFWQQRGHRIATRNLWISIPCLLLAFCVWMLFSAVAVNLNKVGFNFTTDQLFLLTALPSVSGAILRVPYSFVIPLFGGRRWTAISTCFLLVPCLWLGFAVQDSSTPYSVFVIISLLCGFAGANFASSMANISFFFPKARQGGALGLNGGLGNLGVSVMQLVAPLAISFSLFGLFGGTAQNQAEGAAVAGKRRLGLGAFPADCHPGGLVRHERSGGGQGLAAPATAGAQAWAFVDAEFAVSRDLRFFHRFLRRFCHAVEDAIPGHRDPALRILRSRSSVRWRGRSAARCLTVSAACE